MAGMNEYDDELPSAVGVDTSGSLPDSWPGSSGGGGGWTWKDVQQGIETIFGYQLKRDQLSYQQQVAQQTARYPYGVPGTLPGYNQQGGGLMPLLLVGGVIFAIVKAAG